MPLSLCKPKDQSQDQETEIQSLPVMKDDGEPVAPETFAGECNQQTEQDISGYAPRHVKMIHAEDKTIGDPVPFSKYSLHLGQQYAAEQEFFTQEIIK